MQLPLNNIKEFFKSSVAKEGISSIWGAFGVGKTTLALQIGWKNALNGKKVLHIYSKPNFPFNKINSLFESHLEGLLENIQFIKATQFREMFKLVFNLEFIILNRLKLGKTILRTIIIDSLTDLYRLELRHDKKGENIELNYTLNQILGILSYINKQYDIYILLTNELSRNTIEGEIFDVESGGKVMEYWVKNSIKIERTDVTNNRTLILCDDDGKTLSAFNSRLTNHGFE